MSYDIDRCPVCDGHDLCSRSALVSPFLADYLFGGAVDVCAIAQCVSCGLIFFTRRLDDNEVARLYADYRGEEYFRQRHRREFWYTQRINDALGGDADIGARRKHLLEMLGRHRPPASIDAVLDYGGGRGQILAGGPGMQRYVYDLSGAAPIPGVRALTVESELDGLALDLLILCEVLEHASRPLQLLTKLVSRLRPGGLVFITVPQEAFPISDIPDRGWYRRYLAWLKGSRALGFCDFYSTAVRLKLHRIPPLGFAKMHEHINLFAAVSLTHLLERIGLDLLEFTALPGGPLMALGRMALGAGRPQATSSM